MARLPLTVYLPRAELARLDTLARRAGIARSAFAAQAIRARLIDAPESTDSLEDRINRLRAAVEELISAHPDAEAIRSRLALRFAA
jgi:predicted transcriptional regulator